MRLDDTDRVPLIVDVVCVARGHYRDDVYAHDRHVSVTRTRHLCWAAVWIFTDWNHGQIAEAFGRDVTTVRVAVPKVVHGGDQVEWRAVQIRCLAAIGQTQRMMREALV